MQCDLNHVYFRLIQTLFFIEINPNAIYKYCTHTKKKKAQNIMIKINFISTENPNKTNI